MSNVNVSDAKLRSLVQPNQVLRQRFAADGAGEPFALAVRSPAGSAGAGIPAHWEFAYITEGAATAHGTLTLEAWTGTQWVSAGETIAALDTWAQTSGVLHAIAFRWNLTGSTAPNYDVVCVFDVPYRIVQDND